MRIPALTLALLFSLFQQLLWGQYGIGIQGGPFYSTGAWEANEELQEKRGWMAGLQWVEGGKHSLGFRVGLDAGQRSYSLRANHELDGRREEFTSVSTLVWLTLELRWRLSSKHRIFFELGPSVGAEVHERRVGSRASGGVNMVTGRAEEGIPVDEVERGFAVRDGRWRLGVTGEWPILDRWLVTTGVHLCPGVGNWAREHGYATVDASLRAGLLYVMGSGLVRGQQR